MEEKETTNDLYGFRSRRNQGFCRWRSKRQPMISVEAGAGETRDSVDGGAGDRQPMIYVDARSGETRDTVDGWAGDVQGLLKIDRQKTTKNLFGLGAGEHQGFFRWMSKR
jgi:hypothetical protein